jgi:hypothetical protein
MRHFEYKKEPFHWVWDVRAALSERLFTNDPSAGSDDRARSRSAH